MSSPWPRGLIGELAQSKQRLIDGHLAGLPGAVFVQHYTDWVEGVVRRLFSEALVRYPKMQSVSLIALGGFGRGELNLASDIDLMFLYPKEIRGEMETLTQQVLYPLWDLKLDVGHAARTVDDCLELAAQDFQVLVSMLTARRLAGPAEPAEELEQRLKESLSPIKARRTFLEKVRQADQARQKRYGHTPYLLEPHIKEGEGGLRDIHTLTWIGLGCFGTGQLQGLLNQGLMTDSEMAFIGSARDFMWRIRNHLHYLAGGHDDQLTMERQEKVASFLGFKKESGISSVERFMRAYYSQAFGLRNIHNCFFERAQERLATRQKDGGKSIEEHFRSIEGKLSLADPDQLDEAPDLMMKLFAASARTGIKVSHLARQEVTRRLHLVDDRFRQDKEIAREFMTILMAPKPEAGAIFALHGSGLLNAYIPEYEGVFQLPQHDAYHLYTVDVHQLRTVDEFNRIRSAPDGDKAEEILRELAAGLKHPHLLYLAALLHDLGKVKGKGHAQRGARLVGPILTRLGLTDEEAETVKFLIANHLLLAETAARRDISEEKLLFSIARLASDRERLAMLYLLTVADSLATGPRAWTSWQATLLKELYSRVLHILTRRDIEHLGSTEWLEGLKEDVARRLEGELPRPEVEEHLENLSDQYLLSTSPDDIAEHILLLKQLKGRKLALKVEEKKAAGFCELTVVTRRKFGLFYRLSGVLSLNGLNILGAQIHNRQDRISIQVIQVDFPADPLTRNEKWLKVEEDMERVISGRLALSVRLHQKRDQMRSPRRSTPSRPPAVTVDGDISGFHTVVEVVANDRLGLLHDITRVFFELDLEIHLAKISTKVDQVLDVFYVTDLDGEKVENEEQIKELEDALIAILN